MNLLTALLTAWAVGSGHASAKIVVPPPISKRNVRRSQQVWVRSCNHRVMHGEPDSVAVSELRLHPGRRSPTRGA
jgi:hypothetical protein